MLRPPGIAIAFEIDDDNYVEEVYTAYKVWAPAITKVDIEFDSAYELDEDGLRQAIARCKELATKQAEWAALEFKMRMQWQIRDIQGVEFVEEVHVKDVTSAALREELGLAKMERGVFAFSAFQIMSSNPTRIEVYWNVSKRVAAIAVGSDHHWTRAESMGDALERYLCLEGKAMEGY